ncbi:MAG: MAC/perforin domain-containing protein [Pseudomonadota bacterium]|nr:MAC/perforin domain-containing protein [Pseudomonadota bacterium]
MVKMHAWLFVALVCFVQAPILVAQEAESGTTAAPVSIELQNGGDVPVELLWRTPGAAIESLDARLLSGEAVEIQVAPGDEFLVVEGGPADVDPAARDPFFNVTVGTDPVAGPIVIPDPRDLRPVTVRMSNPLNEQVTLSTLPDADNGELVEIARAAAGKAVSVEIYPGTVIVAESDSSSVVASYTASREADQHFDLTAIVNPNAPKATVTVSNASGRPIAVEEHRPGTIVRIAVIDPGVASDLSAVIGAELHLFTNDEPVEALGRHDVTDAEGQQVLVNHGEAGGSVTPLPPGVDLSILPPDKRESAAKFIANIDESFAGRDDVTGYVAYNGGDTPVWFAGLKGESIVGAKQIRPKSTGHIIAGVGDFSIAWPQSVPPEKVTRSDVYASISVAKEMPRVVDVSAPSEVPVSLTNGLCKPVEVFRVDPFGDETLVARLDPLQPKLDGLTQLASTTLVARAGAGSVRQGEKLWAGQLGRSGTQTVSIDADAAVAYDPMKASHLTPDAEPSTVRFSNRTSRAVELYTIDASGAERLMADGAIGAGENVPFYLAPGTVVVFRRPNATPETSEYARYRVTDARTQDIEIGELRNAYGIAGAWIDDLRPALSENNEVGTTFLAFVFGKNGRITGSMNLGDELIAGAARFEGCADVEEAFGRWYPRATGFTCTGDPATDDAGKEHAAYGQFSARRVSGGKSGGKLILERSFCGGGAPRASTWYLLPPHYDDMDPSKEAFQTGMFTLEWAPKSFDWLGRGYDLLRTDPLDYGATDDDRTFSDKTLFEFKYEDAAGFAKELNAKKVFGVSNVNQTGRSDNCDKDEKMVRTYQDLQDFSSESYSGSVGVPNIASFSLSKSHEKINTASTGKDHVFILERCDARLHGLKVDLRWADRGGYDNLRQPVEIGFRQAVEQLPLEWGDARALLAFLRKYGTHFSERVVYGGTFFAETEISKETYQVGKKVGEKLELAAEGTLKKVSLGGTYANEKGNSRNGENSHSSSTYRKWSVGGTGSSVYDQWSSTVSKNPQPIDVSFRPVYDVLTPVFFPDDPDIGIKNALLRQATETYFRQFGKVSMTSDPRALNIVDPRSLCITMDAFELTFTGDGKIYGGKLMGGFVDPRGQVVKDVAPFTLALNIPVGNSVRKDGLGAWVRELNSHTSGNRADNPSANPVHCTPMVSESYIRSGDLYMHGTLHIDDGDGGRVNLSQNFPEKKFPLRRVEPGEKQSFEGELPMSGGIAKYKISIWVNERN